MTRGRTLTSTGIVYIVLAARDRRRRDPDRRQRPQLLQPGQHLGSILTGTSILGFIAIGQTLVILVGSLDLSVPFVASLTSVLAGGMMAGQSGNVLLAVARRARGRRR